MFYPLARSSRSIASRKVGLGESLRRLIRLLESVPAEELLGQIRWLSEFAEE